eukprot:g61565.t1
MTAPLMMSWTNDRTPDDVLGHGTFVVGIIASFKECLGFAPDALIHVFRVFTDQQLSYTSWFLDAFNYAIHSKIDVLNLSIGGPDYRDQPFVDKVQEMSANNIIVVSAIGNDGPLFGTLNNPADMLDVIGVGGIDANDNVAIFSSRGMTTWELPAGYGRFKPDLVTYSKNLQGSRVAGGCRSLSGTSVASPVVAGAVALLLSSIPIADRKLRANPASLKQALVHTALKLHEGNIFEQGAGKMDLVQALDYLQLQQSLPRPTVLPSRLDLTDCPYMWPYCTQPLYQTALPVVFNLTLLNPVSVSGKVWGAPQWKPDSSALDILDLSFGYPDVVWPWTGYFSISMVVKPSAVVQNEVTVAGKVTLWLVPDTRLPTQDPQPHLQIDIPVKVKVIPTPPRNRRVLWDHYHNLKHITPPYRCTSNHVNHVIPTPPRNRRVLWDQFHNLGYPSGYFPRDNLEVTEDILDWNGDHAHTNYRELYDFLRTIGLYVEVLGTDFTCFDASLYGALLVVDPEEEFFQEEISKLWEDVSQRGLSLIILADWYNQAIMDQIHFFDENTNREWAPLTGGANIPALNDLLAPYGIAFGEKVVQGPISPVEEEEIYFASGNVIAEFPANGLLASFQLYDALRQGTQLQAPVIGALNLRDFSELPRGGRVFVYGDSNCVDMAHRDSRPFCGKLVRMAMRFALMDELDADALPETLRLTRRYASLPHQWGKPGRPVDQPLLPHSKVLPDNSRPGCHFSPSRPGLATARLGLSVTGGETSSALLPMRDGGLLDPLPPRVSTLPLLGIGLVVVLLVLVVCFFLFNRRMEASSEDRVGQSRPDEDTDAVLLSERKRANEI